MKLCDDCEQWTCDMLLNRLIERTEKLAQTISDKQRIDDVLQHLRAALMLMEGRIPASSQLTKG